MRVFSQCKSGQAAWQLLGDSTSFAKRDRVSDWRVAQFSRYSRLQLVPPRRCELGGQSAEVGVWTKSEPITSDAGRSHLLSVFAAAAEITLHYITSDFSSHYIASDSDFPSGCRRCHGLRKYQKEPKPKWCIWRSISRRQVKYLQGSSWHCWCHYCLVSASPPTLLNQHCQSNPTHQHYPFLPEKTILGDASDICTDRPFWKKISFSSAFCTKAMLLNLVRWWSRAKQRWAN